MDRRNRSRETSASLRRPPYELVVCAPDGHPRVERFDVAADYKARLADLESSVPDGVTIDDLINLLDS